MKKNLLAALLVAILASSMVFAGISGKAELGLGYNFETGAYGLTNASGVSVNVDLATESAEKIAEGNIYAGIKATLDIKVLSRAGSKAALWADGTAVGLGAFASVKEAYVAGENWKLSILGTQKAPDYAASSLVTKKVPVKDSFGNAYDVKEVPDSYSVATNKLPGATLTIYDWKAAFGFRGNSGEGSVEKTDKFYEFYGFLETPKFDFDGVTLQAAAIASRNVTAEKDAKVVEYVKHEYFQNEDGTGAQTTVYEKVEKTVKVADPANRFSGAVGLSAKVGFDFAPVTGSVAADYGLKKVGDQYHNGLDMVANLAVDPVAIEVYYKNGDFKVKDNNLLSAKVSTDLTSFEVPVSFAFTAYDMLRDNTNRAIKAEVETKIDAFTIGADVKYAFKNKDIETSASVGYEHEMFEVAAGIGFGTTIDVKKSNVLTFNASVATEAIIPGAKLSLAYGAGDGDMNLLKDQALDQNFGKVQAKCTITF